ncbi:MAG: 1,4-beta-D-glucan glucohydrolase, partial [Xanthomonas perforans]|nr:1,4-beta-D-glucan glucohydrolase [Xanthomonas perforans]
MLAACQGKDTAAEPSKTAPAAAPAEASTTIHPDQWPSPKWPFAQDQALEQRITDVMAKMSVEEKVAQTIQGDIASMTPDDVRKYRIGSVLAGG